METKHLDYAIKKLESENKMYGLNLMEHEQLSEFKAIKQALSLGSVEQSLTEIKKAAYGKGFTWQRLEEIKKLLSQC